MAEEYDYMGNLLPDSSSTAAAPTDYTYTGDVGGYFGDPRLTALGVRPTYTSEAPETSYADLGSSNTSDFWSRLSSALTSGNLLPTLATAGLGAYGAVAGSNAISDASKQAAAAQQATSLAQIAELQRQYNQTREDFAPYRELGTQALGRLQQRNAGKGGSGLPGVGNFGTPAPAPQMAGLSDMTASALMSQPNVTNDQVLLASLKGRLGMK